MRLNVKMRLRYAKLIIFLIVILNLFLFYYTWKTFLWKAVLEMDSYEHNVPDRNKIHVTLKPKSPKDKLKTANKHIRKSITIVFRNFYNFESDLKLSIDSILEVIPNMPIIVIQDTISYPPIVYENNATIENPVRFMNLAFDINKSQKELTPLLAIKTKYVLFMPDSVRISNKNLLQKILKDINGNLNNNDAKKLTANERKSVRDNVPAKVEKGSSGGSINDIGLDEIVRRFIIIPFAGNMKSFCNCIEIKLDLPNWTVEYVATNFSSKCDLYIQKHAILADVGMLREMPAALSAPFPEMLYIQAKLFQIKKTIFGIPLQDGRRLFTSYHTKQRRMEMRRKQFKEMYKKLQIKRIIKKSHKIISKTEPKDTSSPQHSLILDLQFSSSNFSFPQITEIDLIGCERTTKSCIGPVYNLRPFYVYQKKHTPPCCIDKLKRVFHHVMDEFENVGIRYWLDNYALKSAIETNKLSSDAYEIDLSFNVNDLERSNSLKKSQTKPFVDNEGFYWIKATDGHYFRVQFSKINQIGVNLLPFEMSGNEVRPSGFFGWKAKEFSSEFLHPTSSVVFLGKNVMCPNNVREFLEFKSIK